MSRTLGPMVPSLTASSTCLLLTVNVLESTLMDNLKLAGDPTRNDRSQKMIDRRRAPDQMARPFECRGGRWPLDEATSPGSRPASASRAPTTSCWHHYGSGRFGVRDTDSG